MNKANWHKKSFFLLRRITSSTGHFVPNAVVKLNKSFHNKINHKIINKVTKMEIRVESQSWPKASSLQCWARSWDVAPIRETHCVCDRGGSDLKHLETPARRGTSHPLAGLRKYRITFSRELYKSFNHPSIDYREDVQFETNDHEPSHAPI